MKYFDKLWARILIVLLLASAILKIIVSIIFFINFTWMMITHVNLKIPCKEEPEQGCFRSLWSFMYFSGCWWSQRLILCRLWSTDDPWITWVWTVWVHLYADLFSSKYYSTTQSTDVELRIQRANYQLSIMHEFFNCTQGWCP